MDRFKTTLLLGGLTALMLAAGYYFGGQQGALIALILSAIMNFGSYWFSVLERIDKKFVVKP